jgi:hypothetical protein
MFIIYITIFYIYLVFYRSEGKLNNMLINIFLKNHAYKPYLYLIKGIIMLKISLK